MSASAQRGESASVDIQEELRRVQDKNARLRYELQLMNDATQGSVEVILRDEIRVYRKGLSHIAFLAGTGRDKDPLLRDVARTTLRDGDTAHARLAREGFSS